MPSRSTCGLRTAQLFAALRLDQPPRRRRQRSWPSTATVDAAQEGAAVEIGDARKRPRRDRSSAARSTFDAGRAVGSGGDRESPAGLRRSAQLCDGEGDASRCAAASPTPLRRPAPCRLAAWGDESGAARRRFVTAATDEGSLLHVVAVRAAAGHAARRRARGGTDRGRAERQRRRRPSRTCGCRRSSARTACRARPAPSCTGPATSCPSRLAGEAVCGIRRRARRHARSRSASSAGRWTGRPALGQLRDRAGTVNATGPDGIRAVISDFGGVLTNHLIEAFAAFQDETGSRWSSSAAACSASPSATASTRCSGSSAASSREQRVPRRPLLGARAGARPPAHPAPVPRDLLRGAARRTSRCSTLMRELRERGYRMAILTNNVREWEELWRAKLPVDEIFELVVDSAWVGMRKPDPEIYHLTIERLGGRSSRRECLFVDDNELNVEAARELGMHRRPLPLERAGDPRDQGDPRRSTAQRRASSRRRCGRRRRSAAPWRRACSSRSCESQGSTMSSASSSPTPARNASSPAEARRQLQHLAPVLAEPVERADQELRRSPPACRPRAWRARRRASRGPRGRGR